MDRTPPKEILEKLRREVNFGCPVANCGVPYLTWHHFDPPWRVREHHDPNGMIALCHTHHDIAEGDRWTVDQLRQMKRQPFITGNSVSASYDYLRKKVVCRVGNLAYNARNVLEIDGERVIGFERDGQGYDRLNVLIRGRDNSIIMEMKNNFWTVFLPTLYDLKCSAQGKEMEILSKDFQTRFEMRFDELTPHSLRDQFPSKNIDRFIDAIGNPDVIPVWTIKGKLRWGNQWIEIRESEVKDLQHGSTVSGTILVNPNSGFSYRGAEFSVG
jgi:hypothetical protein